MIATKRPEKSSILLRQYLCDEVTRIIKLRIFNLEYPRGSRLLVESLAQDLKVSMTPVREGLKSLVAEGLIIYDGKSYSVFNPTEKEIADIFNIRRVLERLSATLAARHMKESDLTYLLSMYRRDDVHRYMSEQSELIKTDKIFHAKIMEGANNPRLTNMLESVEEQCWLIRAWCYAEVFPKWYTERTIEEHLGILYAIKKRDEISAGVAMEHHISNGEKRTWEALKNSAMRFPAV